MSESKEKTKPKERKSIFPLLAFLSFIAVALAMIGTTEPAPDTITLEESKPFLGDNLIAPLIEPDTNTKSSAAESRALQAPNNLVIDNISQDETQEGRHVIKTATMHIDVVEIDVLARDIELMIADFDASIVHSDISQDQNFNTSGIISIRVPVKNFERAMAHIRGEAIQVHHETISTEDVSEVFVDQEARLKSLKAQEEQILATVLPLATSVEEIIQVQEYLSDIRAEIEIIETRLSNLKDKTEYSTITIFITEASREIKETHWDPTGVAIDSFNTLIQRSQTIIDQLIALSISSLPIILATVIAIGVCYTIIKKTYLTTLRWRTKRNNRKK